MATNRTTHTIPIWSLEGKVALVTGSGKLQSNLE
jgi:hypothetical protein